MVWAIYNFNFVFFLFFLACVLGIFLVYCVIYQLIKNNNESVKDN